MNIYHYKLDGLKFSLKSCKKTQITTKGFVVQESQIFGEKDTEQDKLINLVYILYNEKDQKIKIKCK